MSVISTNASLEEYRDHRELVNKENTPSLLQTLDSYNATITGGNSGSSPEPEPQDASVIQPTPTETTIKAIEDPPELSSVEKVAEGVSEITSGGDLFSNVPAPTGEGSPIVSAEGQPIKSDPPQIPIDPEVLSKKSGPPGSSAILPTIPETKESRVNKEIEEQEKGIDIYSVGRAFLNFNIQGGLHTLNAIEFIARPLTALGHSYTAGQAYKPRFDTDDTLVMGHISNLLDRSRTQYKAAKDVITAPYGNPAESQGVKAMQEQYPDAHPYVHLGVGILNDLVVEVVLSGGTAAFTNVKRLESLRTASLVAERGVARIARKTREGTPVKPKDGGVYTEGVRELLEGSPVRFDAATLGEVGELVKRADKGDKDAILQLDEVLRNNPTTESLLRRAEVFDKVAILESKLGSPSNPAFSIKTAKPSENLINSDNFLSNTDSVLDDFNISAFNAESDIDNVLIDVGRLLDGELNKVLGPNLENEIMRAAQNKQLSSLVGHKIDNLSTKEAYVYRQILMASGQNLKKLASAGEKGFVDSAQKLAFDKGMATHLVLQDKAVGRVTNSLGSFNQKALISGTPEERLVQMEALIKTNTVNPHLRRIFMDNISRADNTTGINRALMQTRKWIFANKVFDGLFEVFRNTLLAGIETFGINTFGNLGNYGIAQSGRFIEIMTPLAKADFKGSMANGAGFIGSFHGLLNGIIGSYRHVVRAAPKMGGKTLEEMGIPPTMRGTHQEDEWRQYKVITSENLGATGPIIGPTIDAAGKYTRAPGAGLIEGDLAFKMWHYETEIGYQSWKAAALHKGTAKEKLDVLKDSINNPTQLVKEGGVDRAKYYTFTAELGKIGSEVAKTIKTVPGLRYVVPYFSTPLNIIKQGIGGTIGTVNPVGVDGSGNYRFKESNLGRVLGSSEGATPHDVDVKRAEFARGAAVPAAITYLADDRLTGDIDGSTPDGAFRLENGELPYSYLTDEGNYISFEKIEPLRFILGLPINAVAVFNAIEWEDPDTGEENEAIAEIAGAIIETFSSTLGDTFILGESGDLLSALEGTRKGEEDNFIRYLSKKAAHFVPGSRWVKNLDFYEPYRRANTVIDIWKQKTPGLSRTLGRRVGLDGEIVYHERGLWWDAFNPIHLRKKENSPIKEELIRLEYKADRMYKKMTPDFSGIKGLSSLPGVTLDLDSHQSERLSILKGTGGDGPFTLMQAFGSYMDSIGYGIIPDIIKLEKYREIETKATKIAVRQLLAEDEALQDMWDARLQHYYERRGLAQ